MLLDFVEMLKVIFLGIVEGITEWLPISSTGHMLLVDEFIRLDMTDSFKEMFFVVIQLGAILAVVLLFWKKMFPFQFKDKTQPVIRKDIFSLWFKVVAACIPGAVVTLLFDDYVDAHFHTPLVIAAALIFYGFAFILIENWNKKRKVRVESLNYLSDSIFYRTFSGTCNYSGNLPFRCNHYRSTFNRSIPCGCSRVYIFPGCAGYVWLEPDQTY